MQCPNCGRETEDLIEGTCATCASEKLQLLFLEPIVDATECAHCRRVQVGASWRPIANERGERLSELVRLAATCASLVERPHWDLTTAWEDDKNASVNVKLTGEIHGVPFERNATTRVRFKSSACPDCSREMGGYFEATLQVRGSPGTDLEHLMPRIEDFVVRRLEKFREEGRPNAFTTDVEKARHGHDYVLGSNEVARQLADEIAEQYGAETDETTKLYGRKDGRDVYRWTHLVRLPPYARGDFLLVEEIPYKLISFDRRNLQLLDLNRHVRVRREIRRVGQIRVIGRSQDQRDAIIISRSPSSVQVMDPMSYKTVDVSADGVDAEAASLPVFRHEEILYVVRDPGHHTRQ